MSHSDSGFRFQSYTEIPSKFLPQKPSFLRQWVATHYKKVQINTLVLEQRTFHMVKFDKNWFELSDVRRRELSRSVWIPVFGSKYFDLEAKYPEVGHHEDLLVVGTAIIFNEHRDGVENLDWHSLSQDYVEPYLTEEGIFRSAGEFPYGEKEAKGFRLVLNQYVNSDHARQVYLDQDFILSYGLLFEDNKWVRPRTGYEVVVRYETNESGEVSYVEVRSEYLKDYLAARGAALRLYYFRQRRVVFAEDPKFGWEGLTSISDIPHEKCEVQTRELTPEGHEPGATWAMFKVYRTDVDKDEDVPVFGDYDDDSTTSETTKGSRDEQGDRYSVSGYLWRGEWVEPADKSERLGYNDPEEELFIIADGNGKRENLEAFNYEEVGRYLWFSPNIITALLENRGSRLQWYSKTTGGVSPSPDNLLHFGFNELGFVNAYAYDIARLPLWEKRIWVAHNCRPDGGVCHELLSAQMECAPADTIAPEELLADAIGHIQSVFESRFGKSLLRHHEEVETLKMKVQRFRANNETNLLRMAKDLNKLTIERIDKGALKKVLGCENKQLGTLKLLEALVAKYTDDEYSKSRMAPLFGLYELRGDDAHLASGNTEQSFAKVGVDRDQPLVMQGAQLIEQIAHTFGVIGSELLRNVPDAQDS